MKITRFKVDDTDLFLHVLNPKPETLKLMNGLTENLWQSHQTDNTFIVKEGRVMTDTHIFIFCDVTKNVMNRSF